MVKKSRTKKVTVQDEGLANNTALLEEKKANKVPGLDEAQAKKAIDALFKYYEAQSSKGSSDLLESEPNVWLEIVTKKTQLRNTHKRKLVPLRHSILSDTAEVCLIVAKDEDSVREKLQEEGVGRIKEVISKDRLKANYKTYESLRRLASSYDMFLYDTRLSPSEINEIQSKTFSKQNKAPIPCKVGSTKLKPEMEKMFLSTSFLPSNGSLTAIKFANLSMNKAYVLENLTTALPRLVEQWDNIQALRIKLDKSPSLTLYSSLP